MDILLFIIEVLAACFLGVMRAPVPGVTVVNQTLSCCEPVNILVTVGCRNTFLSRQMTFAEVKGSDASFQKPFQFLPAEGVMQVLECVNFTHKIVCDVDEIREREEIIHYQLTTTPCSKEDSPCDAAPALQRSLFSLLLALAVKIMMMMFN